MADIINGDIYMYVYVELFYTCLYSVILMLSKFEQYCSESFHVHFVCDVPPTPFILKLRRQNC